MPGIKLQSVVLHNCGCFITEKKNPGLVDMLPRQMEKKSTNLCAVVK